MKRSWKKYIPVIAGFCVWMLLLNYSLATQQQSLALILAAIVPGIFLLSLLIIDPELLLYSVILFVPLSIKSDLPGGFSISVPSELIAVIIISYFVIYPDTIRQTDKRIYTHPVFLSLTALMIWLLITSTISSVPLVSFKRTIIQILYLLVFFFLFFTKFTTPSRIVKFYVFYAIGMIIPILNGMIWHSQYNFNPQASYYMPQPFFIEHTIYGAALAFIIPFLYYLTFITNDFNRKNINKIMFGSILLLCVAGEILSFSRAAWLSLIAIPFFWLILKFRIRLGALFIILVVGSMIILLFLNPIISVISRNEARSNRGNIREQVESVSNIQTDISNLERINRWKCALRMYQERPLTGFGPGSYQFKYGMYQVPKEMTRISTYHGEKGNAHSEYLGYLSETGLPGMMIYLVSILFTLLTGFRIIYNVKDTGTRDLAIAVLLSLAPFYVHTIFNGFLENDEIGSLYYGSLAAICALDLHFLRKLV